MRSIGISACEGELAQDVGRKVLEAIYEQDFLDWRPWHGWSAVVC
jgi:hypothetical protein